MMHGGPRGGGVEVAQGPAGGRRRFNFRTFESLKVRNFRFFMASSLAQMACMNMQMMASGYFMYKLSDSAALLGLTMLASAIPQLAFSFLGGIIADRVPKKIVLILGLLASSFLVLWIGVSTSMGIITWHYLVASSFLQGTIMAFMMPSRQAIISELVGRENLMNAIALNMGGMNINRFGAPAIAGFIVAWMGIEGVYYVMTVLYLIGMVLVLPLRANPVPAGSRKYRSVIADIHGGLTYVRDNANVRAVLILALLVTVLSMPYVFLLPVFAKDVLNVGPAELGLLISASGLGAIIGSVFIASLSGKRRGMMFLHAVLATGLVLIAFSISQSYALSAAVLVALGMGQAVRMTLSNTLLQSYTEDAYMGRVMSIFMMEWGVTSLGSFGVSVAAEFFGVQWAVGVTAGLLVVTALVYYASSPRIRKLD